jgi:hypothetical protein
VSGESTHYRAYGLTIRSALSLPELRRADANRESTDVVVRTGDVESFRASLDDDADVSTARFSSVGTFAVVDGREIVCDLDTPGLQDHWYARRVVCTEVLPVVLLQRGSLVMHASAVVVDGRAAVFLGAPGTGKSTIAAAFHCAGSPVLADDIVGIRLNDGDLSVLPGVPQLRLDAAAVAALGIDEAEVSTRSGSESRYLSLTPVADAVPVGGFYVLSEAEPVAVEPIEGNERFFQVAKRTFHDGFLADVDVTPTGFEQVGAVIDAAPVRTIRRPTRYDALPQVVEAVAADLAGDAPSNR